MLARRSGSLKIYRPDIKTGSLKTPQTFSGCLCVSAGSLKSLGGGLGAGGDKAQRSFIAEGAETGDYAERFVGEIGVVAEVFAGVNIGQMDFDKGQCHTQKGVADGDAGVGLGAGVDDDVIVRSACLMDGIDDCTFVVTLEMVKRDAQFGGGVLQARNQRIEGVAAVKLRLAQAEQVEIGAVDQ